MRINEAEVTVSALNFLLGLARFQVFDKYEFNHLPRICNDIGRKILRWNWAPTNRLKGTNATG